MHEPRLTSPYENLVTSLKNCGFLADYHLTVYCRNQSAESPELIQLAPCCSSTGASLCGAACIASLPGIFDQALSSTQPTVFRCPLGLLGFAMVLRHGNERTDVLIGTGVREKSLDLYKIEALSKTEGVNPFVLLEYLQDLPIASEHQVRELADRVNAMVSPMITPSEEQTQVKAEGTDRLKVIAAISADIDSATTPNDIFNLLQETVGILFDVPAIATGIPEQDGRHVRLERHWGQVAAEGLIRTDLLIRALPDQATSGVLRDDALHDLLPHARARRAICQLLTADRQLLGILFFFDIVFAEEDFPLVELLAGRAALRLARLRQAEEATRREALSSRLLSMISTLALTEGQEQHDLMLQMATELVDASCGSLMMLDEEHDLLHIRSAVGMNPHLQKVMSIKLGTGIAGKVAMSGNPLVVNDIEKDERIAAVNRPRFKTKSFISMPLMSKGRVSGVLNLSDKRNNGIFTEEDLQILTPYVSHISSMLLRSCDQEKVEMLERLSITDPLTELYNRRFLERRMEEEINRSLRTGQHLTVMLIDLDYFKTYNDICGHVAGDKALRKVSKVLRASVRDMDVVTRYGGEEFCILLPGTAKRESIFVAERIRRDIENEAFHGEEHLPFGRLTASIGISSFPEDGSSPTSVVNAADVALYEAKSTGRNRIALFNSTGQSESGEEPAKVSTPKK